MAQILLICAMLGCTSEQPTQAEQREQIMQKEHQDNTMTIELTHGTSTPTHAIIWLHGLGASSSDFPPVVPHLALASAPSIRFIFPQAPDRPITVNSGYVMPAWYDIKGLSIEDKQDRPGVEDSRNIVETLIQQQIDAGVRSENIVLAGFSQGGAIAYYTALRSEHKLAGVLAMSTYLLFEAETPSERSEVNREIPIFITHGTQDGVVPVDLGEQTVHQLKSLEYPVEWKTYVMEHEVNLEQIRDIGEWINRIFSTKPV